MALLFSQASTSKEVSSGLGSDPSMNPNLFVDLKPLAASLLQLASFSQISLIRKIMLATLSELHK